MHRSRFWCNLIKSGEDLKMQNYVEFLPSTILSLKPKVICIMVELDPEKKKMRREEYGLSFCTTFTSVNTQFTRWIFARRWPSSGHRKCCRCGDKVKHPRVSLSDILKSYLSSFNVHDMLLLYLNFSTASSKKSISSSWLLQGIQTVLSTCIIYKVQRSLGITHWC